MLISSSSPSWPAKPAKVWDAREVLGVRPGASRRQVERAFRACMKQYDPHEVAHLGTELRELSEEKVREIQMAHQALTRFGPQRAQTTTLLIRTAAKYRTRQRL